MVVAKLEEDVAEVLDVEELESWAAVRFHLEWEVVTFLAMVQY